MKKRKHVLPIPTQHALRKLGQDISDARRRRLIPTELMAEKAGISRATLYKIEKGNSGVAIGYYASVLFVLGMITRLSELADITHDPLGLKLGAEQLPKRIRLK